MMTPDEFRQLVLGMPDAVERAHMGHPDFRANGRIFASLHSNDRFGMVALTPDEQREVMRNDPGMFEPAAGAWGRQGYTNVVLASASEAPVRAAVILAWEHAVEKPKPKPRAKTKAPAKLKARATLNAPMKLKASAKSKAAAKPKRRTASKSPANTRRRPAKRSRSS